MRTLLFALALVLPSAVAAAGVPVSLKDHPVSHGEIITFADLFDGTASTARIGRAAVVGGEAVLDAAKVQTLAERAGLDWPNEGGLRRIIVAAEDATGGAPASGSPPPMRRTAAFVRTAPPETVVKRDETVQVVFQEGGVSLVMQGKATMDAAIGQEIGVLNPDSKKTIQAVITGPGRAVAGLSPETAPVTPVTVAAAYR